MKYIQFYGYKFYSNGDIIGLNDKKIKENKRIKIKINDTYQNFYRIRLMYYVFNQDTFDINDLSKIVVLKDKNGKVSLDNLMVVDIGSVLHGDKNKNSKLTDKQVQEIIEKYNKYSKKDMDLNKNDPYRRISYRKLGEEYGVSHNLIKGIIKGKFRNKDNYIIKEEE